MMDRQSGFVEPSGSEEIVGGNTSETRSQESVEIQPAVGYSPRSSSAVMDALCKYAMLPMRLLFVGLGLAISLLLIATGTSWRDEWDRMDIRGYLFGGKNWNSAGF
jgi:hypothetical protein